jgi:uncharacterized protein
LKTFVFKYPHYLNLANILTFFTRKKMNNTHFSKDTILIDNLPKYEQVTLVAISKKYVTVIYWYISLWYTLIAIGVSVVFILNKDWLQATIVGTSAIGFITIVCTTIFLQKKSTKNKAYALREKDILYRTGWLFEKIHVVPYHKIQHCAVSIGPIEKNYTLASLKIYTAASENTDITIHGLQIDAAEKIKNWLMQNNVLYATTN